MNTEMADMIGGAAHRLGLTFLPTTVRFWIAAGGEVVVWLTFLLGIFLPLGAILAAIIMLVAFFWAHNGNMQEWMAAISFLISSVGLGFAGPGNYSLKNLCCKWNNTCNTDCTQKNTTPKEVISA